jgi:2-amino-4-hydroxy-6-hydroxymethyldihydropteridine diphosphokinase
MNCRKYFLSLGSNLGSPVRNLALARQLLEASGVNILRASAIYITQPVGFKKQPWFYNQVIEVATKLSPLELLFLAKKIERQLKRKKTVRFGPRPIDIDLLLSGRLIINKKELKIPHPRMHQRRFVLEPLNEIAPEAIHPRKKKKIKTLLRQLDDNSIVLRWRDDK